MRSWINALINRGMRGGVQDFDAIKLMKFAAA